MTPFQELVSLVPPPVHPVSTGTSEEWSQAEQNIGMSLPRDYKVLVNTYGVGRFADWICLYSPFCPRLGYNLLARRDLVRRLYAESLRIRPDDMPPFALFPEPGGLLPWAGDDNGCEFCWTIAGPSDSWGVVNLDSHYTREDYRLIGMTATELLAGWFAGRLVGDWYPDDVEPILHRYFLPIPYIP